MVGGGSARSRTPVLSPRGTGERPTICSVTTHTTMCPADAMLLMERSKIKPRGHLGKQSRSSGRRPQEEKHTWKAEGTSNRRQRNRRARHEAKATQVTQDPDKRTSRHTGAKAGPGRKKQPPIPRMFCPERSLGRCPSSFESRTCCAGLMGRRPCEGNHSQSTQRSPAWRVAPRVNGLQLGRESLPQAWPLWIRSRGKIGLVPAARESLPSFVSTERQLREVRR